jgi:hypothetical protein
MFSFLLTIVVCLAALAIVLWMAGAIYFDLCGASTVGWILAISWLVVAVATFILLDPLWKPLVLLFVCGGCFVWWWLRQQPSQDRNWDSCFAQLPRVQVNGDKFSFENVRNASYRDGKLESLNFETRTYRLSDLCGVEALIAYWGSDLMCHPMFIFDFGPDGRICLSIEVRYREGQVYSFLRSIYRQQEIMCVVCEERDAILRRINRVPSQDLYLYRLAVDPNVMQSFFLDYVSMINSLSEKAHWYNGLTTNCTTSIYVKGRRYMRWDWRILFNGKLDKLLYDRKLSDQSMPFAELKKISRINESAKTAGVDEFGEAIRRGLPGYSLHEEFGSQELNDVERQRL